MQYNCTDSITDYLTLSEKKNLYRLHITLERMRTDISQCKARTEADSLHILRLTENINDLLQSVELYRTGRQYNENAIIDLQALVRYYQRKLGLMKVKGWLAGTFGGMAAFGAGVGVTFIILKTQ